MSDRQKGMDCIGQAIAIEKEIGDRYLYCSDILSLADALFNQSELDGAEEKTKEANIMAKELPRPDVIFSSDILLLKIAHARGKTDEALDGLWEMLAKTEDAEEQATIHYELWKLLRATARVAPISDEIAGSGLVPSQKEGALPTGADEHKKAAIEIFEKLFNKTAKYEYKKRIEEIRRVAIG